MSVIAEIRPTSSVFFLGCKVNFIYSKIFQLMGARLKNLEHIGWGQGQKKPNIFDRGLRKSGFPFALCVFSVWFVNISQYEQIDRKSYC